jgi:hypothetical protein
MSHFTNTNEGFVALYEVAQFDNRTKTFNLHLKDGRVAQSGADPGDTRVQICLTNEWERLYYDPHGAGEQPYSVYDVLAFALTANGAIVPITPDDIHQSGGDDVALRRKGTEPVYEPDDGKYPNVDAWLKSKAGMKS